MDQCPTCDRPLGRVAFHLTATKLDKADQWHYQWRLCKNCFMGVLDALEPPKRPTKRKVAA